MYDKRERRFSSSIKWKHCKPWIRIRLEETGTISEKRMREIVKYIIELGLTNYEDGDEGDALCSRMVA